MLSKEKIEKKVNKVKKHGLRAYNDNIKKYFGIPKNLSLGKYYYIIHNILVILICFVILFSNNISHLAIILLIISLDAAANVVLHDCPLTILEKEYLGTTGADERMELLSSLGINYKCNHSYEKVIELIINVWMICVFKSLCIIILRITNIKITNYGQIFV